MTESAVPALETNSEISQTSKILLNRRLFEKVKTPIPTPNLDQFNETGGK